MMRCDCSLVPSFTCVPTLGHCESVLLFAHWLSDMRIHYFSDGCAVFCRRKTVAKMLCIYLWTIPVPEISGVSDLERGFGFHPVRGYIQDRLVISRERSLEQ